MATNASINININSKGAQKSLNTLNADLVATREELDRLIKVYGENSSQADAMRRNLVGLEMEINKLGGSTIEAEKSVGSLKSQLRQMTNELAQLEPGSARFVELSNRAGELRDQIQDTNAVINSTAGSSLERLGKGFQNIASIGVASFQALEGASVLFGIENKDLQEQMVKLQALMNLSMAIETFGTLGDKFTEIKAAFQPFLAQMGLFTTQQTAAAASTAAVDAALVGETVATETATVATTGLGVAMNLLPLAAIATAIGLVVFGLYQMAQSGNEANEALDETIKLRKEETKVYQPLIDKMKEEIGGFKTLITQLQQTNKGSAERSELIKQINSQYGTTIKNIQDETKFQGQLNELLVNYVALQRTRFKLDASKADSLKLFQKEEDLTNRLVLAEQELAKTQAIKDPISKEFYDNELKRKQGIIDIIKLEQKANEEAINKLAEDQLSYFQEEKKLVTASGIVTKETNKEKSKSAEDYSNYLKGIQDILDENTKLEEENYDKTIELSDKKVDAKEVERIKLEENIRKVFEANKRAITAEVGDEKKRTELLKANEDAYTKFLQTELERRRLDIEIATKERLQIQKDLNKSLLLEEAALRTEIRFGDGDTSDTKIANDNKVLQAKIKNLETSQLRSDVDNRVSLRKQEEFFNERQRLTETFIQQEDSSNRMAAKAELDRLISLEIQKYEITKDYAIRTDEETGKIKVRVNTEFGVQELQNRKDLFEKLLKTETDETKKSNIKLSILKLDGDIEVGKEREANAILIEKNLNTVKENLNEEYNQKLLTSTAERDEKLKQLQVDTENQIFQARIDKLDQYLEYASQIYNQLSTSISLFQQNQLDNQEQQLDAYLSYEETKLQQQLDNRIITQEEYDARVRQLETKREQDELKLARKQFKTKKALDVSGAIIDGARATLSVFANTPGELIIKSIAAGIAAAFSATQIALIGRQQFKAAVGGIVPGNGSGNMDSVDAKLAPGEAIINSNSTSAFLPLLSMVNQLGGGKSLMPDLPGDNGVNRFQPVYSQGNNQPVRAYVVSSDIENNIGKMERIRRSTRF